MAEKREPIEAEKAHDIELLGRSIHVDPFITLGIDRMRLIYRIIDRVNRGSINPDDLLKLDKMFSSLISEEDDRWLEDKIIEGELTSQEVYNAIVGTFAVVVEEPKKSVRARRGR